MSAVSPPAAVHEVKSFVVNSGDMYWNSLKCCIV